MVPDTFPKRQLSRAVQRCQEAWRFVRYRQQTEWVGGRRACMGSFGPLQVSGAGRGEAYLRSLLVWLIAQSKASSRQQLCLRVAS